MGILTGLLGACSSLLGGAISGGSSTDTSGLLGFLGGGLLIFGIIILILGVLSVAAGAGALGGSGWARWLGVVVSVLFVIFGVLATIGGLGSMNEPGGGVTGLVFGLLITIGYALTAWAFISASAYFAARR
jgi:hypothetical protein